MLERRGELSSPMASSSITFDRASVARAAGMCSVSSSLGSSGTSRASVASAFAISLRVVSTGTPALGGSPAEGAGLVGAVAALVRAEPEEDDGDVVLAAVLVRRGDQLLRRLSE